LSAVPYRRLPKTDAARLKALEALADNNEVYVAEGHFIDRALIAQAQRLYAALSDAMCQYRLSMRTQVRYSRRMAPLHHHAMIYLSHFIQVLFLAVERGEIAPTALAGYGLDPETRLVPYLKTADAVMEWAPGIIQGERARMKAGGKPILSPSIGEVVTHFDVFRGMFDAQRQYMARTQSALADIAKIRPEADRLILDVWNLVEKHFEDLPPADRFDACRRFGIVYYYRRHEKPII